MLISQVQMPCYWERSNENGKSSFWHFNRKPVLIQITVFTTLVSRNDGRMHKMTNTEVGTVDGIQNKKATLRVNQELGFGHKNLHR